MKKFSESEKEEITAAAQTAGASIFDEFWSEVETELRRMNPELTITPKKTT